MRRWWGEQTRQFVLREVNLRFGEEGEPAKPVGQVAGEARQGGAVWAHKGFFRHLPGSAFFIYKGFTIRAGGELPAAAFVGAHLGPRLVGYFPDILVVPIDFDHTMRSEQNQIGFSDGIVDNYLLR